MDVIITKNYAKMSHLLSCAYVISSILRGRDTEYDTDYGMLYVLVSLMISDMFGNLCGRKIVGLLT